MGLERVRQYAAHNPSGIYLGARTRSKGEAAVQEVKTAVPSAEVIYLPIDLSSFESISNAVKEVRSKSQRLDISLNNAGVMALPLDKTKDGYEIHFGTNHMGHALLTKLLLLVMLDTAKQPGADVRIINLSSEAPNFARSADVLCDASKLDAQGRWKRYGYSKLCNILYTRELAQHYPSIISLSIHPGLIKSDLWAPSAESSSIMQYIMNASLLMKWQDVQEGAKNQLWASTCERSQIINGKYYKPIGSASAGNALAHDSKLASQLWNYTEQELGKKGY